MELNHAQTLSCTDDDPAGYGSKKLTKKNSTYLTTFMSYDIRLFSAQGDDSSHQRETRLFSPQRGHFSHHRATIQKEIQLWRGNAAET